MKYKTTRSAPIQGAGRRRKDKKKRRERERDYRRRRKMKTMQYYANSGEFQGELINNDKYYKSKRRNTVGQLYRLAIKIL